MSRLDHDAGRVLARYGNVVELAATCSRCKALMFLEVVGTKLGPKLIRTSQAHQDAPGQPVHHAGESECGGTMRLARKR